jgi:MraZ protein
MFMGEFTHTLDDKGRLTIPAKFREELEAGAVVTRGFEKYLLIYTVEAFERLNARAETFSPTDPENRALLRFTFANASDSEPDKQGRVIVPPYLREYAGLMAECVIVGVGHYIEVWSKEGWAEQQKLLNDPELNAKRFAALNLATAGVATDGDK